MNNPFTSTDTVKSALSEQKYFPSNEIATIVYLAQKSEGVDGLMNCPFYALSDADKNVLQREVKRLAATVRTRIDLRQK